MIDLHTHALPGIDDGAKNAYESVAMLKDSFSQGVRVCALTPHCTIHGPEDVAVFLRRREDSLKRLNEALNGCSVPALLTGAEVFLDHDISEHSGIKQLCLQNTDFILAELPPLTKPKWLSECIYSLGIRGIGVIIAHLDRYPYAMRVLDELYGFDVYYQINSEKFLSFFNRMKIGMMLKSSETFFVSSDMHDMSVRRNTMADAYTAAKKYFKNEADELFFKNASKAFNIEY